MVSPYLPEGVKHHDFSHQNAVLPSSKWEQSSQTYFAAHRVALPRQHPAAAQRAGGAPAAAHESCSVVPWVAMASSRPPAPAAAAAAAPRLRARRLCCACASARHVRLGGDGMPAACTALPHAALSRPRAVCSVPSPPASDVALHPENTW